MRRTDSEIFREPGRLANRSFGEVRSLYRGRQFVLKFRATHFRTFRRATALH